jgi:tetratricopeptide (TPR) repeat protein
MADKAAIVKEAQKYLSRGQVDKAIAEWEKLLVESGDSNTLNTVGDLYLKMGDKRVAVEHFHKAAKGFWADGFTLKALALYKKIINIDPSDASSLSSLGELSEEKGLFTDAIKYYLAAADILSRDAQKDGFLATYEKILSLAPANIPLREKVAGVFLKEGLISDAIREYLEISRLSGEKGNVEQEAQCLEKVLEIRPNDKGALLGLSALHEKRGDIVQALDYAKKALGHDPADAESLRRCAFLSRELGNDDDAITYLTRMVELYPLETGPHRLMGEIHRAGGDLQRAWESYRKVVDSFVLEKRFHEAAELAGQFRDLDPIGIGTLLVSLHQQDDDQEAFFLESVSLADLLSDKGMTDEALTHYREALKIHSDDLRLKKKVAAAEMKTGVHPHVPEEEKSAEDLLRDADIFVKYGLFGDARSILEALRMEEPENVNVRIRLKSLYLETNDREEAMTECIALAGLYDRNGETRQRDEILKEAAGIDPGDPRLLERVPRAEEAASLPVPEGALLDDYSEELAEAEFYLRQGLTQDALRIYQKLRSLFPDNGELRDKVASVQGAAPEAPEGVQEGAEPEEEFNLEEFTLSETEPVEVPEAAEPQLESDVLDIFEEFKKGLEKELDEEDYETHYNLGIAYKEMGLIDDAIKEFQTSRKDRRLSVRSLSMLGICYMEKGLFRLAIDAFKGVLPEIETRDESYWGAKYDLASAYEKDGALKEAYDIFSEIYGWDSRFREVAEKITALKSVAERPEPAAPVKEKKDRISYL